MHIGALKIIDPSIWGYLKLHIGNLQDLFGRAFAYYIQLVSCDSVELIKMPQSLMLIKIIRLCFLRNLLVKISPNLVELFQILVSYFILTIDMLLNIKVYPLLYRRHQLRSEPWVRSHRSVRVRCRYLKNNILILASCVLRQLKLGVLDELFLLESRPLRNRGILLVTDIELIELINILKVFKLYLRLHLINQLLLSCVKVVAFLYWHFRYL